MLGLANIFFYLGGAIARIATIIELLNERDCSDWPKLFAIILPVFSVAALSLAATFDLEARDDTYEEMLRTLEQHKKIIRGAQSEHEFAALVVQTETRLLGEHVKWFSRRVFTGVT